MSSAEAVDHFQEAFSEGLGTFHGVKACIKVPQDAKPRFFKSRWIPFAVKDKFEESLQRLDRQGVVRPVKTARWAVPVVPVLKQDGQLRICRDLKMSVNPIALVQTYPVPRIDELFTRLQGGIRFTKLKDTYQQIELERESQEQ